MARLRKTGLSRREFLQEAGLVAGGGALTYLALASACRGTGATTSAPPTGGTTAPLTSGAGETTAPPATSLVPPPPGQYVAPADYPGLLDTLGCTSKVASDRWYNVEHMWVKELGGGQVVIGISDKMQMLLDTVSLFAIMFKAGDTLNRGGSFATVEAFKLNTDLYAPVSGRVLQVNTRLQAQPNTINTYPYTDGWMVVLELTRPQELEELVGPQYYAYLQAKEVPKTIPSKRS